jgi:glycosyltransferase involved in cell wall biosynthesis
MVREDNIGMRILLVGLHRFTQPVGLCRYTANLFYSLKREKELEVILALGEWQKKYYEQALRLNVDDTNIIWVGLEKPGISRYRWYLRDAPMLARQLSANAVHAAFPVPFIRSRFPCPIVTTVHDLYAYDSPASIGYPNVWLNKLVLKQNIRSSDAIISISQFTKDSLLKWFPDVEGRMPLPVVYQGVSAGMMESAESQLPKTAPGKFLLCVAQHRKNKNLDLIIDAYCRAVEKGVIQESMQLIIVGSDGPETPRLKPMMERNKGVRFLSAIPEEQLVDLYRSCDALICASSIEGFCLPVAEALSFSRKVVCSDIPILREVAGERGTYFALEPRSSGALVEAIRECLKSSQDQTSPSAAVPRHSGEAVARVYRNVLNRSLCDFAPAEDTQRRTESFGDQRV